MLEALESVEAQQYLELRRQAVLKKFKNSLEKI